MEKGFRFEEKKLQVTNREGGKGGGEDIVSSHDGLRSPGLAAYFRNTLLPQRTNGH